MEENFLEFNSPPDPGKIMAMFNMLPGDVREEISQRMAKKMAADPLSQETIRRDWQKMKADFRENGQAAKMMSAYNSGNLYHFTTTQSWDVKQNFSSTNSDETKLKSLAPILISDLSAGQTHRGRLLVGSIADVDGFWSIKSGAFLLQDISGSVIQVAVYNIPQNGFSEAFPFGREICIVEPFFKIRADGTAGVRVDKPAEILDYPHPQTTEDWKEFGNSSIKHCPEMALTCYEKALQAPNEVIRDSLMGRSTYKEGGGGGGGKAKNKKHGKKLSENEAHEGITQTKANQEARSLKLEVSKVLTNLSLCEFNLGNSEISLLYALLAFGLGLDRPKAAFRIAKALDSSNLKNEARNFAAWYCSSYEISSDGSKRAMFQREFEINGNDIKNLGGKGASWVNTNILNSLVEASLSVKQTPASLVANIKHEDADDDTRWLLAKRHGNELFHKKELSKAKEFYVSALSLCPFAESLLRDSSFIISNKGAAWLGITADKSSRRTPRTSLKTGATLLAEGTICMLSAAMMNFYDNGRAWVRMSRFLEYQGTKKSGKFLEAGLAHLEKQNFKLPFFHSSEAQPSRALRIVQSVMSEQQYRAKIRTNVSTVSSVSTEAQMRQRMKNSPNINAGYSSDAVLERDIAKYEQAYNMYSMMDMMLDTTKLGMTRKLQGKTRGRNLEDYCSEFIRAKGIPDGLEIEYARKVLYRGFVADRLHPWLRTMGWRMAWSKPDQEEFNHLEDHLMTDEDLLKRWHGTLALSMISENPKKYAHVGAIIDLRHMKPKSHSSYDERIRSNFANCPHRGSEVFYNGTTHLEIGFNDLNFLMNCTWNDEDNHKEIPARFVGLEMNAFNVAKGVVITEMLTQGCKLGNVLQAWYSTIWSVETLRDFKKCTKLVLAKSEEQLASHRTNEHGTKAGSRHKTGVFSAENVSNTKVSSYLHHWLGADPISFKEARRNWLDNTVRQNIKMFHSISSCKRREDRLAIAQYCLTGEVFGDANFQPNSLNAVGSLPFWQCPGGSPPLEEDTIFNTFLLSDTMATFSENKERNLVQVFEARALTMLGNIQSRLLSKKLTIELYVGVVKPLSNNEGHDLVHFIADKVKPRTIGWSNVIDYMELGELHDLGRAMSSSGNVVHYGYSMNWCTEVFGANIFDYQMIKKYEVANAILDLSLGENFGGNNEEESNVLKACGTAVGADEVFHYPDYDTPMNSTSYVAAQMTRQYWVDYFFAMSRSSGKTGDLITKSSTFRYTPNSCGSHNMMVTLQESSLVAPCPLHRQSTQTYLEWTYDPKLGIESNASFDSEAVLDGSLEKVKDMLKK